MQLFGLQCCQRFIVSSVNSDSCRTADIFKEEITKRKKYRENYGIFYNVANKQKVKV